ncbi:SNF2 family N-terminal domain-containing protein [Massariosphaeria phaeospora]|uniref:SNF2 family N-terminal domain-containing protein n=1 Tax=Massariosphaeria phaeospora TaxID=100035 RepID=A0A7C8MIH3_9PLEO|nr:SNF2 family N-terminal domain-containing protein [Massariosphaeria phaeospora]
MAYRKRPGEPYSSFSSSQSQSRSSASQPSHAYKQARTGYGTARVTSGSSQADPLVLDSDDDDEGDEEVPDATQGYGEAEYQFGLYGVLPTKIVGVRHYRGMATLGEMAIARREPRNPYDSNAIQVINVQGAQIGHIPRGVAGKLARYMDNRSLLLETEITGHKGDFECPIEIKLYGTDDPVQRERLMAQLRNDRLPVGHATDRKRKEERAAKERQKVAAQAAQAARREQKRGGAVVASGQAQVQARSQAQSQAQQSESGLSEFTGGPSQGLGVAPPSLEDIMGASERFNPRNVDQVVEQFGIKEDDLAAMPKAPQPEALLTQLHDFQLQGLQWMLDKENPQLPAAGTRDVVQLWKRHSTVANMFTNLATNFTVANPTLASGGILADDMGLGKTIQVISLIMADRALGRRAKDICDATLILAPVSVMSNWSTQMKKHIKEEYGLRVMFYHGTRKQPITPQQIQKYDVVISTYDSVSSEWHSQKSTILPRKSGVFSVKWRRVILDEGHNIRNPKAKKTIAVTSLMAQSRWVLTGTPIINNLKDLYSLVRFLGLNGGLDRFEIFHSAIIRPVLQGDTRGNKSLQLLMGGICLRRKKEMAFIDLRLPELSEYVHKITLFPHEQEKYNALEAQAKGTLELYRHNLMGRQTAFDTYRHLLEVLLRMRQLCNHWKLVGEERLDAVLKQLEAEGVVDLTDDNKAALQKMLQLSIESQEECPVCLESFKEPVITKCAHIFCTACIERVISVQHKCPMCRADLDSLATTTVQPAQETGAPPPLTQDQLLDQASLDSETSSKVEALLSILKASAKDPTTKTIVFSQWTSFLDLLQPHLSAAGFTYTRIDGSMTAPQRDAALDALDADPHTTVMLASLAVCSVGLNLVAANQVVMADSWWAPAIEDQAVDRVHRLGQQRETKVFRLVVQGSVEERVLGIQEEKRRLMGLAFAEKEGGRKRRAGAGLADLERLLGQGRGAAQAQVQAQSGEASASVPAGN